MIIKVAETEAEGVGPLMRGTGLNELSVAKKGIFPQEKILGEIGTTIGVMNKGLMILLGTKIFKETIKVLTRAILTLNKVINYDLSLLIY